MSHNNGKVTNLKEKFELEYEESPTYDDEGGVGALNCTLCLVSLSFEYRVISMMNPKP
jgi:hypothetical protein